MTWRLQTRPRKPVKSTLQTPSRFLASLLLLSGTQAHASDLHWDVDGDTTAATGGSGAWNLSDNFWRDSSTTGTLAPWTNGNVARLGDATLAINNSTTNNASSIAGIQIVEVVPEPSVALLSPLALLAFTRRRRNP